MASPENPSTYGLEPPTREHVSLLSVLRRRALIIVLVTLLAGGAAAAFAYATRDTYESTAKLLFSQSIGPELQALGLLPGTPDADNLALNNVEVVGSREVADATARELQARGLDLSADDVQKDVTVAAAEDTDVVEVIAKADSAERRRPAGHDLRRERAATVADDEQREQAAQGARQRRRHSSPSCRREQQARPGGRDLREDIQRLRTLADVGTGSPRIIQRGFVPSSESGNPIQTIVLGAAVRPPARRRPGAGARAVRPQAAAHRAGHGAPSTPRCSRPCRAAARSSATSRSPTCRPRWPRRSGCCR